MSDTKDTQVVMKIPEEIIRAQVAAAVASTLAENSEAFIHDLVIEALNAPARDSYGREITRYRGSGRDRKSVAVSRFQAVVEKGIRDAAEAEAAIWLDEQKDEIKKAVRVHLGRTRKGMVATIADSIIDGLSTPRVHLKIRFGDDE